MGVLVAAPAVADTGIGGGGVIPFHSTRDGDGDIWAVNSDGSGLTNLTNTDTREADPSWSPDGSRIAFESDRDGDSEIFVMNANGTEPTQLTGDPDADAAPAWSPDGSTIAFMSDRTGAWQLWLMDPDGSNVRQLTPTALDARQADFDDSRRAPRPVHR
jgi:TolB protein